jgi:myo-inositol-1(or 4)-monophosphatase
MDRTLKKAYEIALRAAEAASHHLMKRFMEENKTIVTDRPHDVKLKVDLETEELIKGTIQGTFSGHGFYCEESGRSGAVTEYTWIIDPLDGTVNFSRGIPHFCTSIALKRNGEPLIGVVSDPVRKETFSAVKDLPPTLNGTPIRKRGIDTLSGAVIAGGFFHEGALLRGIEIFSRLVPKVKKVRLFGAAALDLCYLSVDRINGYINIRTNEWDVAAASFVALKAGARIETNVRDGKVDIIAADPAIFNKLKEAAGLYRPEQSP